MSRDKLNNHIKLRATDRSRDTTYVNILDRHTLQILRLKKFFTLPHLFFSFLSIFSSSIQLICRLISIKIIYNPANIKIEIKNLDSEKFGSAQLMKIILLIYLMHTGKMYKIARVSQVKEIIKDQKVLFAPRDVESCRNKYYHYAQLCL